MLYDPPFRGQVFNYITIRRCKKTEYLFSMCIVFLQNGHTICGLSKCPLNQKYTLDPLWYCDISLTQKWLKD